MKHRIRARIVLLGTMLLFGTAACTGGPAAPESADGVAGEAIEVSANGVPLTLGLTFVPNVQFAPVYVAAADSVFTSAGLGVSVRHHGSDEGLFSALLSGDEQVVIASGDEVLQARAAGADLVAIGQYYNAYPVEIVVPAESEIRSLADLRGKRIGLPGEFGSNWFGLLAALKSVGLSDADAQIVSVGYTQAAALASGDVDAIVGFQNSEPVQLEAMGIPVRTIELPADVPLIGATVVTTREWLEANGRSATRLLSALAVGMEKVAANPAHALEVTQKWDQTLSDQSARAGAKATLEATIPLWTKNGTASLVQDLDRWQDMGPFMAEVLDNPQIETALPGAVTNQYSTRE